MPNIYKLIAIIGVMFIVSQNAFAQQNIINVPSSDVLPGGNVILKQSNKFSPFDNSYVSLTPSVIVGVGKGVEASVGVGTTISENNSTKMNIGLKKVFKYKKATRFTIGSTLSPNLTEGRNPDSMLYAHTSYLCKKTRTTVTAGGFVGGRQEMPSLTGVMLGIDQTIVPNKLRVVADFISRDESWGAFSAGFKIRPEPTTSITTAVIVPNNQEDRVAFSISISKYLGKVIPEPKKKETGKENL